MSITVDGVVRRQTVADAAARWGRPLRESWPPGAAGQAAQSRGAQRAQTCNSSTLAWVTAVA